jgi:hypothetical protein
MNFDWLFPYRAHLNAEIAWLKEQLAQRQRRIDELQESPIEVASRPSMKVQYERKPDGKLALVQPRGWEEYRRQRRENPEEPEQENNDAIPS